MSQTFPPLPLVCFHHTAEPSLAMRPHGLTPEHIQNLRDYYLDELGWTYTPHAFVDDNKVHIMGDLRVRGTHAKAFNYTSIGIEVLGNYDEEDPTTGRGLKCWTNAILFAQLLGYSPADVRFHREDPTTQKTCPGELVTEDWFFGLWGMLEGRREEDLI